MTKPNKEFNRTRKSWAVLDQSLEPGEEGVFLCTAHPAKFLEVIEETLDIGVPLPPELEEVKDKQVLSSTFPGNLGDLRKELLKNQRSASGH